MNYLANAFSLQMLQGYQANIQVSRVSPEELFNFEYCFEDGGYTLDRDEAVRLQNYVTSSTQLGLRPGIISVIGHPDTAKVLGVQCNRESITLDEGDILFVAQLQGGRLPEGSTTLPEGFKFTYYKVLIES